MKKIWTGPLVLLMLFATTAWSQAASSTPVEKAESDLGPIAFLRSHDAAVKAILANAPQDTLPVAQRDSIKERINSAFDFAELSQLALGQHWQERTAEQRDHFVSTFSGIVKEQNFDSFLRYYREGNIDYVSEQVEGGKATVVATVPLRREKVEIVYGLHKLNGHWRVYDLSIDGASTAEGNRRRYARYIEKHSYDKLILQLDKQLARLRESGS